MRTILRTTTLLVAFAAPTLAQNQPPAQPPGSQSPGERSMMRDMMNEMMGGGEHGEEVMRSMRSERMRRMLHELASGAFFRVKKGNDEVDVHCPPDMTLQSCVGAATDLLNALSRTGTSGGTAH